jgi:hypothetical protein
MLTVMRMMMTAKVKMETSAAMSVEITRKADVKGVFASVAWNVPEKLVVSK